MVNGPFIRVIILATLFRHSSSATRENNPQDNEADEDSDAGVTCYTCVNVSDNSMCNEFAIDHPCPKGENFCHTLHIMDSRGASVVVNKKCADSSECWPQGVSCVNIDSQTNFCHTLHIMDSRGASVVVNKKCADSSECWPQGVGCVNIDSQTVCVSCCDEMYCNVTVPTNKTTATFSSSRKTNKKKQYTVLSNTRARSTSSLAHRVPAAILYLLTSLQLQLGNTL